MQIERDEVLFAPRRRAGPRRFAGRVRGVVLRVHGRDADVAGVVEVLDGAGAEVEEFGGAVAGPVDCV